EADQRGDSEVYVTECGREYYIADKGRRVRLLTDDDIVRWRRRDYTTYDEWKANVLSIYKVSWVVSPRKEGFKALVRSCTTFAESWQCPHICMVENCENQLLRDMYDLPSSDSRPSSPPHSMNPPGYQCGDEAIQCYPVTQSEVPLEATTSDGTKKWKLADGKQREAGRATMPKSRKSSLSRFHTDTVPLQAERLEDPAEEPQAPGQDSEAKCVEMGSSGGSKVGSTQLLELPKVSDVCLEEAPQHSTCREAPEKSQTLMPPDDQSKGSHEHLDPYEE
ncbi:hypothetical protein FOZ61_000879, partial [Perkinsus olseni]